MQDNNPYAFAGAVPAIQAAADERATFLKKVYSLVGAGIAVFAVTLWACGSVPAVRDACMGYWRWIASNSFGVFIHFGILMGFQVLVHAVAHKKPINIVLYFTWAVLLAFVIAPPVLYSAARAPDILMQASLLTAIVFVGLTAVVFYTGKDFSFLGGILGIGMFAMLGILVAGMLLGFTVGLWFSVLGVVLFSGYIVYDTSNILHHYPTNMAVTAAIRLFTDIVLLFQYILHLLLSLNND